MWRTTLQSYPQTFTSIYCKILTFFLISTQYCILLYNHSYIVFVLHSQYMLFNNHSFCHSQYMLLENCDLAILLQLSSTVLACRPLLFQTDMEKHVNHWNLFGLIFLYFLAGKRSIQTCKREFRSLVSKSEHFSIKGKTTLFGPNVHEGSSGQRPCRFLKIQLGKNLDEYSTDCTLVLSVNELGGL